MVKTRFAPSPTGYVHVGSLRTALYCYLFARRNKGTFLLRIEDTDQERYVEGAVENLIKTLRWAGLIWDEGPDPENPEKFIGENGPYVQSQRTEIYREHVQKLLENGNAYRCFCTKERLEEMRKKQVENKLAPMYDRKCLDLPESEIKANLEAKIPFVIRQKIPYKSIKFKDLIRGNVQFDGKTVDDQVLMKSDGFPTYHLANVVDDHLMGTTHVTRGEEWLPSTPKHIALYEAFEWEPPQFAHIPLLLNEDRTKLSKRQGHVAVEEYIKAGYLPEAVINFTAFLGWNPGSGEEREIFSLKELEEIFSLEKVHKAGAIFNIEKLDWFNWQWMKRKHLEKLEELAKKIDSSVTINEPRKGQFEYKFTKSEDEEKFQVERGELLYKIAEKFIPEKYTNNRHELLRYLVTIEEKILRNPKETEENISFYFTEPDYKKELLTHEKMGVDYEQAKTSLEQALEDLKKAENWNESALKETLSKTIEKLAVKTGQVLWPIRSALSGLEFSPGAFELCWALGKEKTIDRLGKALIKLQI